MAGISDPGTFEFALPMRARHAVPLRIHQSRATAGRPYEGNKLERLTHVFSTIEEGVAGGEGVCRGQTSPSPSRWKGCVGDAALRGSDQGLVQLKLLIRRPFCLLSKMGNRLSGSPLKGY